MTITPAGRAAQGQAISLCARALMLCAIALSAWLGFSAASASAAPPELWSECESGTGAGQCRIPRGIAADPGNGHVFVADQANQRIVELNALGEFVRAWGWGVDTGVAEPQVCSTLSTCQAGLSGPGAGQFNAPQGLALDSARDLYVADFFNNRVQKFSSTGEFELMFGGNVITDGATGTATVTAGSASVTAVLTTAKVFKVGQQIEGTGIEPGTRITAVGNGTITLSQAAGPGAAGAGTAISAPEGPSNVPSNETQAVRLGANTTGGTFNLTYSTPNPSPSTATATAIPANATALELEAKLAALANLGAGNVAVTGPAGGPWTVEFKGARFADTDVNQMTASATGLTVSEGAKQVTVTSAKAGEVCEVAAECQAGSIGVAEGQFGTWVSGDFVAIDDQGSASAADDLVYVGDQNRIQAFDAEGVHQDQFATPATVQSLATDASGNLYAIYNNQPDVRKINPVGVELAAPRFETTFPDGDPSNPSAVAVAPSGDVFVFGPVQLGGGGNVTPIDPILVFSSGGNEIERFGKDEFNGSTGLETNLCAGSEAPGNLYVSNANNANAFVRAYGTDPVGCFKARTLPASNVTETSATLNGTVDPDGGTVSECRFEYGTSESFDQQAPCVPASPTGADPVAVSADIGGLTRATTYHVRLVAKVDGETETGSDVPFKTLGPPVIVDEWTVTASESELRVKALVNPEGLPTTHRFEYVTQAAFEASGFVGAQSTPELPVGSDRTVHAVSATLKGLAPGTAYRWRIVATNSSDPTVGTDHGAATYRAFAADTDCPNQALRTAASASLPDCRAYEMVSPVDKNGGDIVSGLDFIRPGGYVQVAPDGDSITYSALASFGSQPNAFLWNQYLGRRAAGQGWATEGIHPPVIGKPIEGDDVVFGLVRDFMAFTPDLCSAWVIDYQEPPPSADGQLGHRNLYRRDNCAPGVGTLEALIPDSIPLPEGTLPSYVENTAVQGVSEDGSHAVFVAQAKLTDNAAAGTNGQIYDRSGGELHLVSVLPGGSANGSGAVVGSSWARNLDNAVSADGARVYWTAGGGGTGTIYLRRNPTQPQDCTDAAQACTTKVSGLLPGFFWGATPDGAKALFGEPDLSGNDGLWVFDATGGPNRLVATDVEGVAGFGRDLAQIYFVSREALAGSAVAGEPNLYLDEEGELTFVGALAEGDMATDPEPGKSQLAYNLTAIDSAFRATRVSADGSRIAFQSRAALTGYDNTETASGKAAVEVFSYEAGGELHCVSCNPSGARPQAREMPQPYDNPDLANTGVPAAAWIPTWEQPLYASNVVSADGGRIFFNSNDALLPRDANGAQDVYQWEEAGVGGCEESDPDYFEQNGGCLALISSGESPFESIFWGASPEGDDVFFTTESGLLPQDPGLVDLYDARAGGGFAQPLVKAPCEGEACQSPPPPPEFGTPASGAYEGPGNVKESTPKRRRCPKGKRKARRAGKVRCVAKRKGSKRRAAKQSGRAGR